MLHAFISKKGNTNQKHPSCKKSYSLDSRPEKSCDKKDVISKRGGQGLCRNAVDHIKNFDNDDPGCKTLWQEELMFAACWVIISIPAQALATPF